MAYRSTSHSRRGRHNTGLEQKLELRRRLIDRLGGPASIDVLETNAGTGVIREALYGEARSWVGFDLEAQQPDVLVGDNRMLLRALSLQRFNLFDVDPFGSPWQQVWLISQHRTVAAGESIGLAITSGTSGHINAIANNLADAGWSRQMVDAMGLPGHDVPHSRFTGRKHADHTARTFVRAWFSACDIEYWISCDIGDTVYYFGCVLIGRADDRPVQESQPSKTRSPVASRSC